MTEDEFRALLAIEGRDLLVTSTYQTRWDDDWRTQHKLWQAEVWQTDTPGEYTSLILFSPWVQRRYYAVQSLIKRYYGDRG